MNSNTVILVVEDDPILKNLLGHTFADKYTMVYAGNGIEGISLMEKSKPTLILLDLMMPDMDGFTFLEKVRSRADDLKSVPIIVMSNLGQQKDIERAKSLGANKYLVKVEVSVNEIIDKIQTVLAETKNTTQ